MLVPASIICSFQSNRENTSEVYELMYITGTQLSCAVAVVVRAARQNAHSPSEVLPGIDG